LLTEAIDTAEKLHRARAYIANGLNAWETATRLKVSKTALYTALQAASAAHLVQSSSENDIGPHSCGSFFYQNPLSKSIRNI
jgi:hypothetical protein